MARITGSSGPKGWGGGGSQASQQAAWEAMRQQVARQQAARQETPRSRGRTPPPVNTDLQPALFDFLGDRAASHSCGFLPLLGCGWV